MSGEGGKSTARSFLPIGIQIHWVRTNSQTNRVSRIENPPKFDSWSHPTRKQLTTSPNFFSLIVFSIEEQSQQPRALGSSQGGNSNLSLYVGKFAFPNSFPSVDTLYRSHKEPHVSSEPAVQQGRLRRKMVSSLLWFIFLEVNFVPFAFSGAVCFCGFRNFETLLWFWDALLFAIGDLAKGWFFILTNSAPSCYVFW